MCCVVKRCRKETEELISCPSSEEKQRNASTSHCLILYVVLTIVHVANNAVVIDNIKLMQVQKLGLSELEYRRNLL